MGRAGRPKGEMPPGLEELEEHGVPGGWNGFWHGQQNEVQDLLVSEIFPNATSLDILRLQNEPWTYAERQALLEARDPEKRIDPDDPVVQALWKQEVLRLGDLLEKADIDPEDLRGAWMAFFQASHQAAFVTGSDFPLQTSLLGMLLQKERAVSPQRDRFVQALLWEKHEENDISFWARNDLLPALHEHPESLIFDEGPWSADGDSQVFADVVLDKAFGTPPGTTSLRDAWRNLIGFHSPIGNSTYGLRATDFQGSEARELYYYFKKKFFTEAARRICTGGDEEDIHEISLAHAAQAATQARIGTEILGEPRIGVPREELLSLLRDLVGARLPDDVTDQNVAARLRGLWKKDNTLPWLRLIDGRTSLSDIIYAQLAS